MNLQQAREAALAANLEFPRRVIKNAAKRGRTSVSFGERELSRIEKKALHYEGFKVKEEGFSSSYIFGNFDDVSPTIVSW